MKKMLFIALLISGCTTVPQNVGYGPYAHWFTASGNLIYQVDHNSGYECENDVKSGWKNMQSQGYTARCDSEDLHEKFPAYLDVYRQTGPAAATKIWFITEDDCLAQQLHIAKYVSKGGNGSVAVQCSKNKIR